MEIEIFDNGLSKEDILDQERHTACRGIIKKGSKYSVVRIPKHDIYMFPGGGLEVGETLKECTKREVKEETGMEVMVEEHTVSITEVFANEIWTNHYFICEIINETNEVSFTEEEKELELEQLWIEESKLLDIFANNMGNHPHAPNIHQREFIALMNSL
jgi:8-oxo-dGTP pyrophosphatase MutT (NUDIX family)